MSNIAVTPGTGKTVATETVGGIEYQQIKLIDSTASSTTPVGTSANPLPVVQTGTPSLPTGAATAANQSTANASLSSIDGKITAVNTGAVVVASGTVTTVTTLTGTTSLTPGTGAANLGKAEDAAHSSGDVGVMSLAVRNDAGTVLAGTDQDYIPMTTDSTGALRTTGATSLVSTNNSSTSVLGSGVAFTGTSDDALNYSEVRVTVFADQVSATDGLSIQQSSNGSNWDITDTYSIAASAGKTFVVPRQARYVRVVYTNGATLQGNFRLQTILNRTGTSSTSQRASDAYSNENDLEQGWAFASLYNGTTWDRMRGDITNGLDADVTRVIPGTAATNLGKAEDSVHSSGDTGVFILEVSNENLTAFAAASGDYTPPATNRYGQRYVTSPPPSHASTNGTPVTATTTSVVAAPSAGNHLRVVRIHMSNGGSTSAWVAVRDGASGTRHYNTFLPQNGVMSLNLNLSGPLDLTSATRLDIFLSAAASIEYEIDYLTVAD